ncbi:MAG TPA: radical SAM protein, partial [Acidimicrobiales bacterium]|nr:radical SAM protein [Acidimicrobiales bacterium]
RVFVYHVGVRWKLADEEDSSPQGALFAEDEVVERHVGTGEYRGLEFLHVRARSVLNRVPGGERMGFRWTVNPYRGCSHSCVYCFARPTHEYLGLGTGRDFDTKIVVKVNAVERLRAELSARRWAGELIAMGTNTDPYQRCEGKYRLTQGIVRTLAEFANPFSILTKSTLILRDLPLLVEAARRTSVRVNFSIGTLDEAVWKATEPGTPHPRRRVEAVRRINEAGIPCGVLVAPVIPGMSDAPHQLEEVVGACADAGAVTVSAIPLHLRRGVKEHWMAWVRTARPDLVDLHTSTYRGAYAPKPVAEAIEAAARRRAPRSRRDERPRPHPVLDMDTEPPMQGTLL